ncbi:MAG: TlpA disulfide reductase family protein [Bryobacteraceae bacterium]
MRLAVSLLLLHSAVFAATGNIIADVRAAIAQRDFSLGEKHITDYRSRGGVTPEMLAALSWLGRGALAEKQFDKADAYAAETRKLALSELKKRPLDAEAHLPIALGASIEVQAHVMDGRGERGEAVSFLKRELEAWRDTSIRTRIQKNIHLLSLEGKPAPALELAEWVGEKPVPVEKLKGNAVLLFFWAHWCGDCKGQAPVLAQLQSAYGKKGLIVMGPTQRYGYTARGEDAAPEMEKPYIDSIRRQFYSSVADMRTPVSEENFKNFGVSTTPTLVLIDRKGIVRLYHPGKMPYQALAPHVEAALGR